ncbi:MAG: hypothetical protein KatS3mg061_3557 [Dehalococcoidia bacterium]|nr:MAG: hypothetical protein KatS3mg061_3557 [Dehalococcoidia bacterium]
MAWPGAPAPWRPSRLTLAGRWQRLLGLGLVLASLLPACQERPLRWQALALPAVSPAWRNGEPEPLVLRTLRLTLPTGQRRVQNSDEDEPALSEPGTSLAMHFRAATPFRAVGLVVATDGRPASVLMRLWRGEQLVGEQRFSDMPDRSWIDLAGAEQPAGEYRLELVVLAGRAGWWSQRLAAPGADPPGFRVGAVPLPLNSEVSLPVNATLARIAVLGGLSSYDHGIGWWRDYEVQGDSGDRQFVGDTAGWLEVRYASGARDLIPLTYGWTLWWRDHLTSERWGGPFPQPFADPAARAARDASLRLLPVDHPLAPFRWDFLPRPEPVVALQLRDNPAKQGVPVIAAISLLSRDPIAGTLPLADEPGPASRAIQPRELDDSARAALLAPLAAVLTHQQLPAQLAPFPEPAGADLQVGGSGRLLTAIWRANTRDLAAKFSGPPPFQTSSPGAPHYGGYQGIGAWRDDAGYFANQVWARDLGRAALEVIRQGQPELVERALRFAGDRLYDLPNGYPRYSRDGTPIPPHWTTVLGDPLYLDADHRGDGNWENDSQGLLILAYFAAWQARGRDQEWLARHVGTVRDAAGWFLEQLAHPERWRSRDGLLYGEGEAANDGGYDVLSNTLAWRALRAAAEMVAAVGEGARASAFREAAERIRAAVATQLRDPDGWRSVAWNWGYGHEALAPVFSAADVGDYDLSSLTAEERAVARQTYLRQLGRCPQHACVRAVGYGQGFLAQAALLLDDLETAATLLERLATLAYDERRSPYLIPEGIALAPDGSRWYRTGDLGNAVQQGEVLKALALVAGVERGPTGVRLLPRLPATWQWLEVERWPLASGTLSLRVERMGDTLRYQVATPVALALRVGPVAPGSRLLVDGVERAGRPVESGGRRWLWVDALPAGRHEVVVGP